MMAFQAQHAKVADWNPTHASIYHKSDLSFIEFSLSFIVFVLTLIRFFFRSQSTYYHHLFIKICFLVCSLITLWTISLYYHHDSTHHTYDTSFFAMIMSLFIWGHFFYCFKNLDLSSSYFLVLLLWLWLSIVILSTTTLWILLGAFFFQYALIRKFSSQTLYYGLITIVSLFLIGYASVRSTHISFLASISNISLVDILFLKNINDWGHVGYFLILFLFMLQTQLFLFRSIEVKKIEYKYFVYIQNIWSFIVLLKFQLHLAEPQDTFFQKIAFLNFIASLIYKEGALSIYTCILCYALSLPYGALLKIMTVYGIGLLLCYFSEMLKNYEKKWIWLTSVLPGTPLFGLTFFVMYVCMEAKDLLGMFFTLSVYIVIFCREISTRAPLWLKLSVLK